MLAESGPGEAPPGFILPTTSQTEWVGYWALATVFDNPRDPRVGPFEGGFPDWAYQQYALGGRSVTGGAVVDFVVQYTPRGRPVGIRLQTEYFHLFAPEERQNYDLMQTAALAAEMEIVDVFDYDLLRDKDGSGAVIAMKRAVGLLQRPDPLSAGTAERVGRPL